MAAWRSPIAPASRADSRPPASGMAEQRAKQWCAQNDGATGRCVPHVWIDAQCAARKRPRLRPQLDPATSIARPTAGWRGGRRRSQPHRAAAQNRPRRAARDHDAPIHSRAAPQALLADFGWADRDGARRGCVRRDGLGHRGRACRRHRIDAASLSGALIRQGAAALSWPMIDAYDRVFGLSRTALTTSSTATASTPALRRLEPDRLGSSTRPPPAGARGRRTPCERRNRRATRASSWGRVCFAGAGLELTRQVRHRHPQRRAGRSHPVVRPTRRGLVFAGRLSAEKGAAAAIEIALLSVNDRPYGPPRRGLRAGYPATTRGRPSVTFHDPCATELCIDSRRAGGALSERLGRAVWPGRGRGPGRPGRGGCLRRGGLREIVEDGVTGFLVEPGQRRAGRGRVRSVERLDRRTLSDHASPICRSPPAGRLRGPLCFGFRVARRRSPFDG